MKYSNSLDLLQTSPRKGTSFAEKMARQNGWLVFLSLLLALGIWTAVVDWSHLPDFVLPSPAAVGQKFWVTLADGTLLHHTLVTLSEVLSGLLIGSCLATCIGYFLARSRALEQILSPFLVASQAVPTIAIAPLLIIWFGSGMAGCCQHQITGIGVPDLQCLAQFVTVARQSVHISKTITPIQPQ